MRYLSRVAPLAFALAGAGIATAQAARGTWEAPPEAKSIQNPTKPDEKSVANGKRLFKRNCVPCHNETGRGDGPMTKTLGIKASNLTDGPRMKGLTDGEIFWKISKGKEPMPVFERKLTGRERWELVAYVRTLS